MPTYFPVLNSRTSIPLLTLFLAEIFAGCEGQRHLLFISTTAPDVTTHATTHDPSGTTKAITLGSLPYFNSAEPKDVYTPLQRAVMMEESDKVSSLIRRGADINEVSSSGKTPLHYAVMIQSLAMVELLLKNGAKVEAKDNVGKTPLDYWEPGGKVRILQLLHSYEQVQGNEVK